MFAVVRFYGVLVELRTRFVVEDRSGVPKPERHIEQAISELANYTLVVGLGRWVKTMG